MTPENDDLRTIYRAYAESRKPVDRTRCPSVQEIADSFDPGASRRKKKRIIDHLSACSYCREEFDLCFRLQTVPERGRHEPEGRKAAGLPGSPLPAVGPGAFPIWRAASLVLGFGLIISALLILFRGTELIDVQRTEGPGVVLVSPLAPQPASIELIFRWEGYPAAQHYVLELFDETLLPVWISPPIQDPRLKLPDDMGPKIRPGSSYYWMVTAYAGQDKIGESGLAHFKILEK
jgi:hypothetical protein